MNNLVFTDKTCAATFGLNDANFRFNLKKPMLCPICNAYQDGTDIDKKLFQQADNMRLGVVMYRCTHCNKKYLVLYSIDLAQKNGAFAGFYPQASMEYANELLSDVSPRFILAYNQALRAESRGDKELAAIGYRQALECLVKDYAIKECSADHDNIVDMTLFKVIGEYLGESDLVSTADVVRILGNDYAHYERRYPEHDFDLLKRYMEIFIKLVETKLLIAHPPVSRHE